MAIQGRRKELLTGEARGTAIHVNAIDNSVMIYYIYLIQNLILVYQRSGKIFGDKLYRFLWY